MSSRELRYKVICLRIIDGECVHEIFIPPGCLCDTCPGWGYMPGEYELMY